MTLKTEQISHTHHLQAQSPAPYAFGYGCDEHECLKYLNIYKAG